MKAIRALTFSTLALFAAQSYAVGWGDFNAYAIPDSTKFWSGNIWEDADGNPLSSAPTLSDSVYLSMPDTTTKAPTVQINSDTQAFAKSFTFGVVPEKTFGPVLKIVGNGFLYVGNTGDVGGTIGQVNSLNGNSIGLGWTAQTELNFTSDNNKTGTSSRFTNATNINVYALNIGTDGAFAGTEWLMNTAGTVCTVAGWLNIGSSNNSNKGDLAASIKMTAGTLNTGKLLLGSSLANNAEAAAKITIDGGTLNTVRVLLGNAIDAVQSNRTVNFDANVNFLSGTIAEYNNSRLVVFSDTYKHDNKQSQNLANNGAYNINFGEKTATYSGYAGVHSAAVFNTGAAKDTQFRFDDSVFVKNYESQKGGFTIRGAGVLSNYAQASITGKISVLDTATLMIAGTSSIVIDGATNVDMTGKMFASASEIYVASGAKYDFSAASDQQIFAGQTLSGAGNIKASTTQALNVNGAISAAADDGKAGRITISGNGTVKMAKSAQLIFNLYSNDGTVISSNDSIAFVSPTEFIEANVDEGLGTMIFDASQIMGDTSILLTRLFANASADWSKFNYETTEQSRVQALYNAATSSIDFIVTVPEPAGIGAILAAIALAIAAWRRRK